ncbi:OmpW/AlkL family protein [Pseudotenacibaculum haliotis]|uniref:OmpW family protein n=1 Tax=Pseudotenacibaculum haliotis TaxID=1862138 RepID=A0ABW5LS82_9FLAO
MKRILLGLFMVTCAMNLQAQENENDDFNRWKARFRLISVSPSESATIGTIGGDVEISSAFVPELDFTYFFTKNWAVELILATTKHDVNTIGSDLTAVGGATNSEVDLGSVWLLPPTLSLQYHFDGAKFKPYVGAGLNYTFFYSVDAGNAIQDVDYDNSFGFSFQAGIDYELNDKWFLNLDAKYLLLNTDVTVDASNLAPGLSIPAEVDINPFVVGIGFGYNF